MRFDLVAFDLYGTLLAIEKLEAALAPIVGGDARKLLADWRKAQLRRTWELNERGEYEPFGDVTARALAQVAPHLGPRVMERACQAWLTVPAHPDAAPALRQLRAADQRVGVLHHGVPPPVLCAGPAAG